MAIVRFQELAVQSAYDHHFRVDPFRNVALNAAMIGISDQRWESVPETDANDVECIRARMSFKRFDVLPVVACDGVREYFVTSSWNDYSIISRRSIEPEDLLPYDTSLSETIRRLAIGERRFYFLTGPKPVIGLISAVNLNCRQVKVFLFNLLAELEVRLAALVARSCSQDTLLTLAENRLKGLADSVRHFEDAKSKGADVPFVEYLTLPALINVVVCQRLHEPLGYSRTTFEKFGKLAGLRNAVAHPVRSLMTDDTSCRKLWERLQLIEELLASTET